MQRILLTGGMGFIGLNVAEALLNRGDDVLLLDRQALPPAVLQHLKSLPGRVGCAIGDVRDQGFVAEAAGGRDGVIHGAAITPGNNVDGKRAALAIDVNVLGTLQAMLAAGKTSRRKVILLGSASVYGAAGLRDTILDEAAAQPEPVGVYAATKYAAERLANGLAGLSGVAVTTVRIGAAFGPWERNTGVRDTLSPIYQVTRAARAGSRQVVLPRAGRRDWVYSRDIAAAVLQALDCEAPPSLPVNIGSGHEWTVADWCERLQGRYPHFSFRLAQPGETPSIDFHGPVDRPPLAVERMKRHLEYQPRFDLTNAFADYIAWMDANEGLLGE